MILRALLTIFRFKIDVNAQQLNLTGAVLLVEDSIHLVLVEGGPKAIKRYIKLMIQRIRWRTVKPEEKQEGEGVKEENEVETPAIKEEDQPVENGLKEEEGVEASPENGEGMDIDENSLVKKEEKEEDDYEDDEEDDYDDDEDDEEDDGDVDDLYSVNTKMASKFLNADGRPMCELVWKGVVVRRAMSGFKFQECKTEDIARRVMDFKGVAHYWDMVIRRSQMKNLKISEL